MTGIDCDEKHFANELTQSDNSDYIELFIVS